MMKLFKRDLFLCAAITGFVIMCALAWGSPFVASSSHSATVFAKARQMRSMTLRGAVLRIGDQLLLRDGSGVLFHLDNPQPASGFEGRSVSVSGELESISNTLHIDRIEPGS